MGEGREGLSLKGLAERLEAQTRRLEALERENAELRGKVAALESPEARRDDLAPRRVPKETGREAASRFSGSGEAVSRRAMLTKAGAAAVAAVAAGTLLSPREARAATVFGDGNVGVYGTGTLDGAVGVKGDVSTDVASGYGVVGYGKGNDYSGVYGNNGYGGYGVDGEGATGVYGHTPNDGSTGVYGKHEGATGYGVTGQGTGTGAGVLGSNASGAGVEANQSLYGGKFDGSRAPLVLVPKGTKGRPTSGKHQKGEIYLDSVGALFVCTKGGTPGTWRHVTTTSA
jgi:hypothetical protein